jgi:DNA-binding MarR family transcriptional regulator
MDFEYFGSGRPSGRPYEESADHTGSPTAPFAGGLHDCSTLQLSVRRARGLRDLRKKMLGPDCFSGPAWDVLLHLFESHVLQRRDTIGNVCDGAGIPATTALRWLYRLEDNGMISLSNDHLDNRRRFVKLSDGGVKILTNYFAGIAPHLIAA